MLKEEEAAASEINSVPKIPVTGGTTSEVVTHE